MKLAIIPDDHRPSLEYLANLQADHSVPSQRESFQMVQDQHSLHL